MRELGSRLFLQLRQFSLSPSVQPASLILQLICTLSDDGRFEYPAKFSLRVFNPHPSGEVPMHRFGFPINDNALLSQKTFAIAVT